MVCMYVHGCMHVTVCMCVHACMFPDCVVFAYVHLCAHMLQGKALLTVFCFVQADRAAAEERLAEALASSGAWASRFDDLRSLMQFHPSSGPSAASSASHPSVHQPSNCVDVFVALLDATLARYVGCM